MLALESGPDILEVTLRDGSYLIDFQFTAEDTATIAAALEAVGFRWIEVGHGLGLHASESGKGVAAATDEEYLAATSEALHTAWWGMFFIPGIGRLSDLELAVRHRMSFVRVGADATKVDEARRAIERAKELGLLVSYNAMKSYAVTPVEFGALAARVRDWGVDVLCLVDSAGGMVPRDVTAYFQAVRDATDVPLAFHGHDNLCLAVANSLRAVELGAVLVDSSLHGMGRSAGNAKTEALAAILKKSGYLPHVDLTAALDAGRNLIGPLMRSRGLDPLAITAGYAGFHSSFTPKVRAHAARHGIDSRDLIVRLCEEDQVDAPDDLLERLSREIAASKLRRSISIPAFGRARGRRLGTEDDLPALVRSIRTHATKAGRFATLNIVQSAKPLARSIVSGNIQTTVAHTVGSVTIGSRAGLDAALASADGAVDVVLLDADQKGYMAEPCDRIARATLNTSQLLTYSDDAVWITAVENQIIRLLDETAVQVPIVIAGDQPRALRLAWRLHLRGAVVTVIGDPESAVHLEAMPFEHLDCAAARCAARIAEARLVTVWPRGSAWFGIEQASCLGRDAYVIDAGIGGLKPEALEAVWQRGARLIRVNIWPALSGALEQAHESARVLKEALGWSEMGGVSVVAGGAVGRVGDVIVDSVSKPTRVIGVADGRGGVLFDYDEAGAACVRRVTEEINRRLLAAPE